MYRSKYKLFKGKFVKYIVQMMREAPNKSLLLLPNSRAAHFDIEQTLIHRLENILIPFVNNWMSFIKEWINRIQNQPKWGSLAMETK